MTLDLLFNGANLFVLPFWALIALAPNWSVTRQVMNSYLPFLALACLYVYLFTLSLDPENVQSFANPTLSDLARLFSDQRVMAAGWVHFLIFDLFVGRWIYLEGQRTGVWTRHSLVLCLFAGPMGLLSHIVTQAITQRFFSQAVSSAAGTEAETETV